MKPKYNINDNVYCQAQLSTLIISTLATWKISPLTITKIIIDSDSIKYFCETPSWQIYTFTEDFIATSLELTKIKFIDNKINLLEKEIAKAQDTLNSYREIKSKLSQSIGFIW